MPLQSTSSCVRHSVVIKRCTRCKLEKPIEEFGPRSSSSDGYQYQCRPCVSAASNESHKKRRAIERASRPAKE